MPKKTEIKKKVNRKKISAIHKKQLKGEVVSDKMEFTASVKVTTFKIHPIYKKRYRSYKKYLVHNHDNTYKIGESVLIEECIPKSRHKKWQIIKKIGK